MTTAVTTIAATVDADIPDDASAALDVRGERGDLTTVPQMTTGEAGGSDRNARHRIVDNDGTLPTIRSAEQRR